MGVEIIFFGQLTDKVGSANLIMDNPGNIEALKKVLFERFPLLIQSKFTIAINNKIVLDNVTINEQDKIALMPPFSGG